MGWAHRNWMGPILRRFFLILGQMHVTDRNCNFVVECNLSPLLVCPNKRNAQWELKIVCISMLNCSSIRWQKFQRYTSILLVHYLPQEVFTLLRLVLAVMFLDNCLYILLFIWIPKFLFSIQAFGIQITAVFWNHAQGNLSILLLKIPFNTYNKKSWELRTTKNQTCKKHR